MKLFNTLTKNLDEVKPLDGNTVRIYSCGPTVYDHSHIGNLSSFIFADTLRRVIALNHNVKHVMNFTDVDDKTIRRSGERETGEDPKVKLKKLTEKYENVFLEDMASIGNDISSMTFVKATQSIDEMQKLITALHAAGFAYVADDGVYFSIAKYRESGKKYGQLLEITEASTSEARIQNDEYDKDSAHDFALWKVKKPGEPAWEFNLDGHDLEGRPGWHIECSAMSKSALGQPFDIHTGGIDLVFPHHENEIAQSTALTDSPVMATFFAHNGHLFIDGKKMSKSLNNFHTLEDIKKKGFDPLALRLLVLQSNYRSEANFTWEILEAAQNSLKRLEAWADLRHQTTIQHMPEELDNLWGETLAGIQEDLNNDLNSPQALAKLHKLVSYMENIPVPSTDGKNSDGALAIIDKLFGLRLDGRPDITSEQKVLIQKREEARTNKDFEGSDHLRQELENQGLLVRDTPNGPVWSRK
ncbi:MAG: cysS [Candidatus Saccharibacteria bacterium]|nr:cysS [Candidatus Saccharibacteria bacterium]